jgi:aminopeptidase-like protein
MSEQTNWDGEALHKLAAELYPICRSITGNGVRETLAILGRYVPMEITEVPSGTQVFDWEIPREWNVREAWIKRSDGAKVIDFKENNLHLVSYSIPVRQTLSLEELKPHLHTHPDNPAWIPYRTSYYSETWGFCLTQRQLGALEEDDYEVLIDTTLKPGNLTYGEVIIPGGTDEEVLIYSHCCHPSLANDNVSGLVVCAALANHLLVGRRKHRYSYRFVFGPGTIGSITWLALNEGRLNQIKHGLVAALLGGNTPFTYKMSRNHHRTINRVIPHVLKELGYDYDLQEFSPYGYDERQFCSPGIDLPVGRLTRRPNAQFPEYHSSGDNLQYVTPVSLEESLKALLHVIYTLEHDRRYRNLKPKGEPQLGKRGLYRKAGGTAIKHSELAILWVLNQSDGQTSLLEISEKSGIPLAELAAAAEALLKTDLLDTVG